MQVFMIISCCVCFIITITAHATIDSDSIVGIWLFEEGKGRATYESTGNVRKAWLEGPFNRPPKWKKGKFGCGLELLGVHSVTIPHFARISPPEEVTFTVWVKLYGLREFGRILRFTVPWGNHKSDIAVFMPQEDNTVQWRFGTPYITAQADINTPVINVWRHWAFVQSIRDNLMAIYLDGELFASTNDARAYAPRSGGLRIGKGIRGRIDEFGVFQRRLSQEEIQAVMTHGLPNPLAVKPNHQLASTWGKLKLGGKKGMWGNSANGDY